MAENLPEPPHIESLRIQGFRVLRDITIDEITPLTVLLGPNGSGKSTVFDVFAFLAECFEPGGLRKAWDKRGRFKELRTRDVDGPIIFELKYRERRAGKGHRAGVSPLITYHLEIDETRLGPVVRREWLQWSRGPKGGKPFKFMDFQDGEGQVVSGEHPDEQAERVSERLQSSELLAVSTLGQLARHPRVGALRSFITGWYLSYLSTDATRRSPEAGPSERLSKEGDNLPNVIQYLQEQHPERLQEIEETLRRRVPRLAGISSQVLEDGRLLLQVKDAPFTRPVLAKFASDGTLKLLAYLTVLLDPSPAPLIGVEEPENFLHPRLLPELAEECRRATERSQVLVTTHSPFFINGLQSKEVRVLYRDEMGHTHAESIARMPGIDEHLDAGARLGELWMEGFFPVGDPLLWGGASSKGYA